MSLMAISPLDGRYVARAEALSPYFSEWALIRYRFQVEVAWLMMLST
jgi:adenylosuccinate lyase